MHFKSMLVCSVIFAGVSLSSTGFANPLTITNNTNHDSTSIINHGVCSKELGAVGVTRAHTVNHVPDNIIQMACFASPMYCVADIYMTDNCKGPKISTVVFSVNAGIISASKAIGGYDIYRTSKFSILMQGGPA